MSITSVLLEVASIQQYVFGSNKLKENLGASYLVKNIFNDNLKSAFQEISINIDFDDWHKKPEKIQICDSDVKAEIGYIGGGNALLFFKENSVAKELARLWSRDLLLKTPGLMPSIAIRKMDCSSLNGIDFQSEMNKLFENLTDNKYRNQPQTMLPRHGITAECNHTGLSAECFDKNDNTYISSVAKSKIMNVENAKKEQKLKFKHILKDRFDFPNELDNLGQKEGDNHISIVHIDGNGMGKRFRDCKKLEDMRHLSNDVRIATEVSFGKLLEKIVQKYDYFIENFDLPKYMLPLRPIIIGGDDVTFVTHGKLGVYFAKNFMEEFSNPNVNNNRKLSSCAGVAITKTKYPFYRGYELAEDLCNHAKKKARVEETKSSSWIDFHIAYGGFSGTLEEIRKKNYIASEGCLCLRPYRLEVGDDHRNFDDCLNGIKHFKESEWPKSKLSELREILERGIPACEMFIKEMEYREKILPDVRNHPECQKKGWSDEGTKFTPYFDMLELKEFYPFDIDSRGD